MCYESHTTLHQTCREVSPMSLHVSYSTWQLFPGALELAALGRDLCSVPWLSAGSVLASPQSLVQRQDRSDLRPSYYPMQAAREDLLWLGIMPLNLGWWDVGLRRQFSQSPLNEHLVHCGSLGKPFLTHDETHIAGPSLTSLPPLSGLHHNRTGYGAQRAAQRKRLERCNRVVCSTPQVSFATGCLPHTEKNQTPTQASIISMREKLGTEMGAGSLDMFPHTHSFALNIQELQLGPSKKYSS